MAYRPRKPGSSFLTDTTSSALAAKSPLAQQLSGFGTAAPYRPPASRSYAPQPAAHAPTVQRVPVPQPQNTAPTPGVYDISTDPILQQIQALGGRSNEDAQAGALKQREQLLLQYGDQGLAQSLLGPEDPVAQAAGQNPFSTLAQLNTQHGRNISDLTEQLNRANLLYSGYRVNQEQQAAHDYQAQLAGAAGAANQGLDTIASNLAQALAANDSQRVSALLEAYQRQQQEALATGYGPAAGTAAPPSGGDTGQTPWAPTGGDIIDHILQQPGPARTTASVGAEIPTDPQKLLRLLAQAGGNKLFAA